MPMTFDTPVVVVEVGDDLFRLFRGSVLPAELTRNVPTRFSEVYCISGPIDVYPRLNPPDHELTRKQVLGWLESMERFGCDVRAIEHGVEVR